MPGIFAPDSRYKKQARFVAILWTLLIFAGCFLPAKEIPHVTVPLIDKWVHFVLFGGFAFFWLLTIPDTKLRGLLLVFGLGVGLGIAVELLQAALAFLGRSAEVLDAVADSIGTMLGVAIFARCRQLFAPR